MTTDGKALLEKLFNDPDRFFDQGDSYHLVNAYFSGFPLSTLKPAIQSTELRINRVAMYVMSELGSEGISLLEDAVILADLDDKYVSLYLMDVIIVNAVGHLARHVAIIARKMAHSDAGVRHRAMTLLVRASIQQLEAAALSFDSGTEDERGLSAILRGDKKDATALLQNTSARMRLYGAILAARLRDEAPELWQSARESDDVDVRTFAGVEVV